MRTFFLVAAICAAFFIGKACLKKTDKFMVSLITCNRDPDPQFDARPLSSEEEAEVKNALNQKYTYFGCGGQAYVFFSQDGNYVLKFFKQHHFQKPTYLNWIPFITRYRERKYEKRKKRLSLDYHSYKMGFEELPEETAILYPHLNPSSHLNQCVTLVDKLHIEHQINLDQTDFLLQRRARLVTTTIEQQMAVQNVAAAKETISKVLQLVLTRCQKGFGDRDPNILTNCGILNGKAIKIDVGRFTHDPRMSHPLLFKPELYRIVRPFRLWLQPRYPELVEYLENELIRIVANDS